jgi:hypothetical protein
MWDWPRLARDTNMWSVSAKLAPTAVLPGNWVILPGSGHQWVLDIQMSTDTAIGFTIQPIGSDPSLTQVHGVDLFTAQAEQGVKFEAQVVASPSGYVNTKQFGRVPLNTVASIWGRAPFYLPLWGGLMVFTDLVAANVTCTFIGVSFA